MLEDYNKYTFVDYEASADNMFIGVRSNQREAFNYYYQVNYDEAAGYSVKLVKSAGWETVHFEGENGPETARRFIEEEY